MPTQESWSYQAAIHPEDRENGIDRFLFSQTGPIEGEIRLRRHDGVYRRFRIRVEPFCDSSGRLVRRYGTSMDLEGASPSEIDLQHDDLELRRVIDSIPQVIVVLDPAGAPLYANRATLEYTGLETSDTIMPKPKAL